jgi:hypothetical protein
MIHRVLNLGAGTQSSVLAIMCDRGESLALTIWPIRIYCGMLTDQSKRNVLDFAAIKTKGCPMRKLTIDEEMETLLHVPFKPDAQMRRAIEEQEARRRAILSAPDEKLATRCPCSFPHPPHDRCDGNPDAEPFGESLVARIADGMAKEGESNV